MSRLQDTSSVYTALHHLNIVSYWFCISHGGNTSHVSQHTPEGETVSDTKEETEALGCHFYMFNTCTMA